MNAEQANLQAKLIKWTAAAAAGLILLFIIWPFNSVPTGSRGVVTQFGKIVGIEPEGLAILPPWRKLSNFSIRAETASIDDAEGATSDTQPVRVALTVRYSIFPDRVGRGFRKVFAHRRPRIIRSNSNSGDFQIGDRKVFSTGPDRAACSGFAGHQSGVAREAGDLRRSSYQH
jgi:SPFH domain / Band 7 family